MLPTIESLAAELAAGRTSSVELTRAALARAADPAGEGARVFTRVDGERALALARAADALRAAGAVRSPLDGLPVSLKDLFDIAGQTTCAGSVLLRDAPPAAHNATAVFASSITRPIVMNPWICRSNEMCVARLPCSVIRCAYSSPSSRSGS